MELRTRNQTVHGSARKPSAGSGGVLVVDSDGDTRSLYRDVLGGSGTMTVVEATDGREALVTALGARPHIAIVDARLPYISGIELCALLRADPLTSDTRVILTTGDSSPEHIQRCRQSGAYAVFIKPVAIELLAAAVRDLETADVAIDSISGDERELRGQPVAVRVPHRVARTRVHERYVSTSPPEPPPHLRCPHCDSMLQYDRSHVGGVSDRHPEQWDYFVCARHGTFQYRHRTRKLRAAS